MPGTRFDGGGGGGGGVHFESIAEQQSIAPSPRGGGEAPPLPARRASAIAAPYAPVKAAETSLPPTRIPSRPPLNAAAPPMPPQRSPPSPVAVAPAMPPQRAAAARPPFAAAVTTPHAPAMPPARAPMRTPPPAAAVPSLPRRAAPPLHATIAPVAAAAAKRGDFDAAIADLNDQMRMCIAAEQFEKCGPLRDQIKQLEEQKATATTAAPTLDTGAVASALASLDEQLSSAIANEQYEACVGLKAKKTQLTALRSKFNAVPSQATQTLVEINTLIMVIATSGGGIDV
jgi:hypothetical protein